MRASWARRAAIFATAVTLGLSVVSEASATPAEANKLRGQARIAMDRKDYKEAADLLDRAYKADPSQPAVLKDLAVVLASDGKIDDAAARYRQYLKAVPSDDAAALALATTLSWGKEQRQREESDRLLGEYLAKHPESDEALLQRARVRSWSAQIDGADADYTAYLAKHPEDEKVKLELAVALSGKKDPATLARAVAIYDAYLAKHPTEAAVVLQRGRVHSWANQIPEAAVDYRAYLKTKPDDEAVAMELARALSWSKRPEDQRDAIALLDRHLAAHPDDKDVLLARARAYAWTKQNDQAIADFQTYLKTKPDDDAVRLELARAIAQSTHPGDALPVFDAYLAKHPNDFDARARRARALLWIGDYGPAETALRELVADAKTDAERTDVEVDLARLYAQTGRRYTAVDLLDDVLARDAKNEAARAERERVGMYVGSRVEPKFFAYDDKSGIRILVASVEGRAAISKGFALVADVGGWSLGTTQETLYAARANVGAWTRLKYLELEAAAGPRLYEYFDAKAGGRAWARLTPTGWASALLYYHYDDLYFDMLQPASVSAGIRGHALQLTGDVTLPLRVRATGRVGVRSVHPDNRALDLVGTVMVPIVRPFSVGYSVQFLTWEANDPSYWSPQEFASHLGVIRAAQTFYRSGFGYDVQGVLGIAGERIAATPEAGFGPSFGGSGAIIYQPTPRLELRLSAQYSQTVRELPRPVLGGSTGSGGPPPQTTKSPSRYYWITGTASATIYF